MDLMVEKPNYMADEGDSWPYRRRFSWVHAWEESRQKISSTALAKITMKSPEVPLRPTEIPFESMAGYDSHSSHFLWRIVIDG